MHAEQTASRDETQNDTQGSPQVDAEPLHTLSQRELQTLTALCRGLRPREVAANLGINIKTVSTYRERLLRKTGCRNGVQLGIWAERVGLSKGVEINHV